MLADAANRQSAAGDHPKYRSQYLARSHAEVRDVDSDGCRSPQSVGKEPRGGELPAISEANILSTFEQLHHNKQDVFERGIINVFKGLSWDYKTNNPCYFGKKIIVNNLVKHDRWGYSLYWGWRRDQLADLERMFYLLDGKTIPDNRHDVSIRFMDFVRDNPHQQIFEDELFTIRYFQKGSGHITFKRLDLVDKMNDIVAKHYPSALSAK